VWAAEELALVSDLCTAMASEALLGNRGHFNAFIHEQKPHPGQVESARVIRELLVGSGLSLDSEEIFAGDGLGGKEFLELDRQVQDRYSIRCAPHVNGALRDTLAWVRRWVEVEINSSDDNPLFDAAGGRVQSGGNFYGSHITQAMDSLKIAVANLCDLMDRQLELVVDEKFNAGPTPNLIPFFDEEGPEAGVHHGFKAMQLCSSAALQLGDDGRGAQALQPGGRLLALHRGAQPGQGEHGIHSRPRRSLHRRARSERRSDTPPRRLPGTRPARPGEGEPENQGGARACALQRAVPGGRPEDGRGHQGDRGPHPVRSAVEDRVGRT
jgi:hypothetical protein